MAAKIKDTKGREIRLQLSKDRKLIDLYLGPEKTRHHSPVVRWWAGHRVLDAVNAKKFAEKIRQLIPKLR